MTDIAETTGELREKIRDIIAGELELEADELTEEGNFVEDYDADSLSLITIVARIEKEAGVRVPKEELPNLVNLANVYKVVDEYAAAGAAHE